MLSSLLTCAAWTPERAEAAASHHAVPAAHETQLQPLQEPVSLLLAEFAVLDGLLDGLSLGLGASGIHGTLHGIDVDALLLGDLWQGLAGLRR